MPGNVHLALVIVVNETGGGGDPHVQQILLLHLHQLFADEVIGASILNAGDAALRHDLGDLRQDVAIDLFAARVAGLLRKHVKVSDRDFLFGRVAHYAGVQADVGRQLGEHTTFCQGFGSEANAVALFILGHAQGFGVVGAGMAIDPGQDDRVAIGGRIEGLADGFVVGRRFIAFIGNPLIDLQPGAGFAGVARQAFLHLAGQLIEVYRLAFKVADIQGDGAQHMDMVVVQAWQNHLAAQIDHLKTLLDEGFRALPVTGIDEPVVGNGDRFDLPVLAILRVNLAVEVHRAGADNWHRRLAAAADPGEQGDGAKR
ncbi:hypothetical protein D3C80_721500 [compost metagenome]